MANEQDISVFDKDNPVLGATTKEQDMSRIASVVVPVGAFTDPHNPYTQSLSVNLPLADAPLQHSEDYGADVRGGEPGVHLDRTNTMSEGANTITQEDHAALDLPEDRDEWTKAHWQRAAKHYGLAVSGNVDTLRGRVEDFEAEEEATDERRKELHAMSRDDLNSLAESNPDWELDPSDFNRKEDLADAILSAESGNES